MHLLRQVGLELPLPALTAHPTLHVRIRGTATSASTAYKLMVGHPPGAPLFQLTGRIFTLFAEPATSEVAVAINILSALCSAFTILFLFWTITAFAKKIYYKGGVIENTLNQKNMGIFGAGLVGALAYFVCFPEQRTMEYCKAKCSYLLFKAEHCYKHRLFGHSRK